jgi:hypothetical protein
LTTTFGAARRSSVATIDPSRRRRVRAAAGFAADGVVAAGTVLVRLAFVMALPPVAGVEQRLDGRVFAEAGRLRGGARRLLIYARCWRAAKHRFSGPPEIF